MVFTCSGISNSTFSWWIAYLGSNNTCYQNKIYDVLVNYIVGETDRNGYTPKVNRTILIDNNDRKVVVNDYKLLEIITQ